MTDHNPIARYCIEVDVIPVSELRDDVRCPSCDELHGLMHLDPDVTEVLTREPWCASCAAGDRTMTAPDLSAEEKARGAAFGIHDVSAGLPDVRVEREA